MADSNSTGTSDSIVDWDGNDPVALSETKAPAPTSFARRLSTAASNYFSLKSDDSDDNGPIAQEAEMFLDQESEFQPQDFYGGNDIVRAMSKKSIPDVENYSTSGDNFTTESSQKVTSTSNKKVGFWDKEFKQSRLLVYSTFASNYVWLVCGFIAILSLYWGSFYDRLAKLKNLNFAVINADRPVGALSSVVGATIEGFFEQVPILKTFGNYDIWDYQRILQLAQQHNNTITEEVYRLVHHYKYWAAFYVNENSTLNWHQALLTTSPSFTTNETFLEIVYETGQNYNAITKYIVPVLQGINRVYFNFYPKSNLTYNIQSTLSPAQLDNAWQNSPSLLTQIPTWRFNDRIPVTNEVFQAPFQIGIIYLVIFAFFQFLFTFKVQTYLLVKVTGIRYTLMRIAIAQVAYMIISLGFVVLNTAFGLNYNLAFGNLGFLVIWMIALLTVSSLGSLIEILVLIVAGYKQQLIGFVLLFVAIFNVTPLISPIVISPIFYRYGYGAPAKAAYELFQVAYFDAWKGYVGKNVGILCAWIVGPNLILPFVLKLAAKKIMEQKRLEAEKEQKLVKSAYEERESQLSKSKQTSIASDTSPQNINTSQKVTV